MARKNNVTMLRGLKALLQGRNKAEVARDVEIDYSTLHLLAKCERGPSLKMARDLAKYFKTSVETLIGDDSHTGIAN